MSINAKARVAALSEQLANPKNPADLGSFEGVPNIPTIATDTVGPYVFRADEPFMFHADVLKVASKIRSSSSLAPTQQMVSAEQLHINSLAMAQQRYSSATTKQIY